MTLTQSDTVLYGWALLESHASKPYRTNSPHPYRPILPSTGSNLTPKPTTVESAIGNTNTLINPDTIYRALGGPGHSARASFPPPPPAFPTKLYGPPCRHTALKQVLPLTPNPQVLEFSWVRNPRPMSWYIPPSHPPMATLRKSNPAGRAAPTWTSFPSPVHIQLCRELTQPHTLFISPTPCSSYCQLPWGTLQLGTAREE